MVTASLSAAVPPHNGPRRDPDEHAGGETGKEKLRELIVAKNFDFFNDWRLKTTRTFSATAEHEQGRNAPEMAEFEKLADEADIEIARNRAPLPTRYELRLQK